MSHLKTITVSTWGRTKVFEPLGSIKVRISTDDESALHAVVRSIERRTGLVAITTKSEGWEVMGGQAVSHHWVATLGTTLPSGGWMPEREIWFAINTEDEVKSTVRAGAFVGLDEVVS